MERYRNLRQQIMENAALLWSFREILEAPKETQPGPSDPRWQLGEDREQQLADHFAFIASPSNDPIKVVAVCIEEHVDGSGIVIRVAMNSGSTSEVVQNLQRVADVMMRASRRDVPRATDKQSILDEVVSVCKKRLLSRLRSRHGRRSWNRVQQPFAQALKSAISTCQHSFNGQASQNMVRIQQQSQALDEVSDQIEAQIGNDGMQALLLRFLVLAHEFDVKALVSTLAQCDMLAPSLKAYLPRTLGKLSHYINVARDLAAAARTNGMPVLRNIHVVAIPGIIGSLDPIDIRLQAFKAALSRAIGGKFKSGLQIEAAAQKYNGRVLQTSMVWRVHAEIQILLYYQLNRPQLPPRYLCASKSACFLCALFCKTHGMYKVPRTHGKIYEKWTLPMASQAPVEYFVALNPVMETFNKALKTYIRMIAQSPRKNSDHPNESVVAFYGKLWMSSSTIPIDGLSPTRPLSLTETPISARLLVAERTSDTVEHAIESGSSDDSTSDTDTVVASGFSSVRAGSAGSVEIISPVTTPEQTGITITRNHEVCVIEKGAHFYFSISPEGNDQGSIDSFIVRSVSTDPCIEGSGKQAGQYSFDLDSMPTDHDVTLPVGPLNDTSTLSLTIGQEIVKFSFALPKPHRARQERHDSLVA